MEERLSDLVFIGGFVVVVTLFCVALWFTYALLGAWSGAVWFVGIVMGAAIALGRAD